MAPRDWRFAAGAHGKPYLVDAPIDLRFSLSHTRGMVAVAIAKGAEIGVDVEGPRGVSDAMKLAERYFTTPEVALLRDTPEGDARREIFLRIWTLKEAVIKAVGEGLVFGLERFSVRTDPPSVAFNDGEDRGEWTLALWRRGEFHIAAAVCGDRKKMPREPDDAAALIRSAAEP
ncbi:MAG: 4'-phosphopantetheinyl transferase superfamily protein [Methylocystis sp.]|nr:4'-phosphopantetheinyl transferase superfamily protein [Methylocystis sp.]